MLADHGIATRLVQRNRFTNRVYDESDTVTCQIVERGMAGSSRTHAAEPGRS